MQKQKERARNAAAVENSDWVEIAQGEQQFVGYDYTEYECHILRYRKVTQKKNEFYELVLDYTPFYGEMGGQVGDCGVICNEAETIDIIDTKRENNQSVHIVKQLPKDPSAQFMACVDTEKRDASAANHTATHLLDYALKQVLGDHVEQKGSFVSPDTLRFDFSHFEKVSDEQIREVERMVNDMIRQDIQLDEHRDVPFDEAKKLGAIALFGEKYGDKVRVVRFGPSCEFCGGIHAKATGKIGFFKIISESSVAAGIRRIEAKTGKECEELRQVERMVNDMIRQDIPLDEHREVPFDEAKKLGAIALFGEKYGDKVRVVRFGPSCEFCGGIHAKATGKIGFFKIIAESSVAAGIRRIEAKTGRECEELLYQTEDTLRAVKAFFNNAKDLQGVIAKYIEEHDSMKKDIEQFQAQRVQAIAQDLVGKARLVNGMKVVTGQFPMMPNAAKDLVFKVRELIGENLVCVVGTVFDNKPMLNVMLSDDMVKDHGLNAGQLVREAAKLMQGGGGGQPHYASAGGKNPDGLSAAIDKVVELANL